MRAGETPRPPATPEFGAVTPNGPIHHYPVVDGLQVSKRSVGDFDNDCYLVRCANTGRALLIDGAAEPDLLEEMIGDATLIGIAQTHGHWDHVRALEALVQRHQVPVQATSGDGYPVPALEIRDGDLLEVGDLRVQAWHRPGHTPGSTCFVVGGFLFSGDTLFPGGPGNTFGDQGAFEQIMVSLDLIFADLGDDMRICPGHGLDSTIGRERPHLETWRRRGW